MKTKFNKRCEELGVSWETEGLPVNYGAISIDCPDGYIFSSNSCHFIDFHLNPSWKMAAVYIELIESMKLGIEKCKDKDCDTCKN